MVADDLLLEVELWLVLCPALAEEEVGDLHGEGAVVPHRTPVRDVLLLLEVVLEHEPPRIHAWKSRRKKGKTGRN